MRILGVDPGLRITGYGVIDANDDGSIDLVEAGLVRTGSADGIAERLRRIHDALDEVVGEHRPDRMAIERLYAHYEHPTTAILMGHARGAVCLVAGRREVPLTSLASTHVKKALTGHGHAAKAQIQRMVQSILGLNRAPEPADVADALAIAIACAAQMKGRRVQ